MKTVFIKNKVMSLAISAAIAIALAVFVTVGGNVWVHHGELGWLGGMGNGFHQLLIKPLDTLTIFLIGLIIVFLIRESWSLFFNKK